MALEVLTGMFADDDDDIERVEDGEDTEMVKMSESTVADDDEAEEDDDDDDDPMLYDAELSVQMQTESMSANLAASASTSTAATRFARIEELQILPKILALAGCSSNSGCGVGGVARWTIHITPQSPFHSCVLALDKVRLRAFECLQNLFMAADAAGWFASSSINSNCNNINNSSSSSSGDVVALAGSLWVWLFEAAHAAVIAGGSVGAEQQMKGDSHSSTPTVDLVDAAVSAMWALARGLEAAGMTSVLVT